MFRTPEGRGHQTSSWGYGPRPLKLSSGAYAPGIYGISNPIDVSAILQKSLGRENCVYFYN